MLDVFISALTLLLTENLLYLIVGILIGTVIGILPGLGGTAGMALILPFVYGMDQTAALAVMIGLLGVVATGDTFTSILMGVPGSAGSQATVLDGFPMAKRGEAARALGAAFFSSMLGGLIGAATLTVTILIARPIVLSFGAPELLILSVFGLSLVGILSGTNLFKGIAACCLGLLLGSVGSAPATGHFRMTLDTIYLSEGLSIALVALAIFALPELVYLLKEGGSISSTKTTTGFFRGQLQGAKDVIKHRWITFRGAMLGCTVGAIPGLGGSVIDWLAYGNVVQFAKDKSQFGKGDVRGVIAVESSNNAKDGGALIPTLLFGIPGSGGTAVLLGGLTLIGLTPGPRMLENNLDTIYVIIWSLALANVIGAGLCFWIAGPISKLTELPYVLLAPFMIVIIVFGAYQSTREWADLITLIGLGSFALLMKRYSWPRPPLLIGFVLASGLEVNLYQSVQLYGSFGWMSRPIVVVLLVLTALTILFGLRTRIETEIGEADPTSKVGRVIFAAFMIAAAIFAIVNTWNIPYLSKVFSVAAAVTMLPFALLALWQELRQKNLASFSWREVAVSSEIRFIGWILGLLVLIAALGFFAGVGVFITTFLLVEGKAKPVWSALCAALTCGAIYAIGKLLVIKLPESVLLGLL
jgi:TctA family transporter